MKTLQLSLCWLVLASLAAACSEESANSNTSAHAEANNAASGQPREIVVYCGRSKSFMDPLFDDFEQKTGITTKRVYSKTAEIALKLQIEADRSPADVVLAQDAGALGELSNAGLLAELPSDILSQVEPRFASDRRDWIATSLRVRTLAYSTARVDPRAAPLPQSVFDLTDPTFANRVGWAPGNASFKSFVTAMRHTHGQAKTRQWLADMKANGAQAYPKNTAILQAIAAGEVDFGLPNHYYLVRFLTADPGFPVAQTHFAAGDIGNMVNVAGAGVLKTSRNTEAAQMLIDFLVSAEAQAYFVNKIYEYPVTNGVAPHPQHGHAEQGLQAAPAINLNAIDDLEGTMKLLRDVGLL